MSKFNSKFEHRLNIGSPHGVFGTYLSVTGDGNHLSITIHVPGNDRAPDEPDVTATVTLLHADFDQLVAKVRASRGV